MRQPSARTGLHIAEEESQSWRSVPYEKLALLARKIAGALQREGLGVGLGACVVMPTGALCVGSLYAVWACGASATLIPPPAFADGDAYAAHVGAILGGAAPHTVLTTAELVAFVELALDTSGLPNRPVVAVFDEAAVESAAPADLQEPGEVALVQFTSGSTASPRGVMVSWENLRDNIQRIMATIGWEKGDSTASWLPLYHDMGLVGALLTTVANQGDLYLMRPDQFVREPIRWLQAMAKAQHTVSPSFGIGYAARRLKAEDVADLDLSGWRSLVTGAEPVDLSSLSAFCELAGPRGFRSTAFVAAYGLAEATLMVSGTPVEEPIVARRIDQSSLRMGEPVSILESAVFGGQPLAGEGWIAGLGPHGREVSILDEDGKEVPDGTLGQIVVDSSSVAMGYCDLSQERASSGTRFCDGTLHTGDAGFRHDGQLYALGRMGWALKVRGKSVFMEDFEARLASATGLPKGALCAAAIPGGPVPGVALFVERPVGDWLSAVQQAARACLGPAHMLRVVTGPRGFIRRTSSGKPQRSRMWQLMAAGELAEATVLFDSANKNGGPDAAEPGQRPSCLELPDGRSIPLSEQQLQDLLDKTLAEVEVDSQATILLEGSLAEGFGNEASDIDFLAVLPGEAPAPTMPSVMFVEGSRTEVRTRSFAQLREQLDLVAHSLSEGSPAILERPGNDVINRCQRFLRSVVLRRGSSWPQVEALRDRLPYREFSSLLSGWWLARAQQSLRQAVALMASGAFADGRGWARDGLQQAAKGWAAAQGECYIETKWLPLQLGRLHDQQTVARYWELDDELSECAKRDDVELLDAVLSLAEEFGVTDVANDSSLVRLARVPGVTTWPIGGVVHVLRGDDVFVLSDEAALAWRAVVFGRPVSETAGSSGRLAEFVRLGLVGLRWRTGEPVRPAIAMCEQARPYTCPPSTGFPLVGMAGAPQGPGISLSPLPARRFVESGMNLIWSNVVVENAREDLAGAVKSGQWRVADLAKSRLVGVLVRVIASACGASPLPADVAALSTASRLLPESLPGRGELLGVMEEAVSTTFSGSDAIMEEAASKIALLDDLVRRVRAFSGCEFPASFHSREQWGQTLESGYNWLRMGSYLNADLPLDEARDLLESGGRQPHKNAEEAKF
ncbi:AMP-dependent synthetase and ligase [Segniliparus rotundus DSM 44985]|uniref:AMP-dependent synthetase and ligase n=1 Tax=Segniliparus rotundus (strain ATCC BAA-972 / CDC 1076 / CIP 108378 / DSM 44985 / JCM 13578) TaxID=640132 RepID=D6Z772_SEGRD|nr:AMP-binding protein [Segniliparus rotundus]ADG97802.1 AMP-dependent synthetase and ligase [Segniliparus rotundus DSM 44985]